ncbi:RimK/LysX family protein [Myxococcota bacterium]|nr:RimK/LysX family protein [Myxococcota bacterium]
MVPRQEWSRRLALGAGLLVVLGVALPGAAKSKGAAAGEQTKQIAGWVERITLWPARTITLAKLDTGARTSSIHAEDIERFERGGRAWVRYTLVLKESKTKVARVSGESLLVRKVYIKDHQSQPDARPVVELEFCMDGRRHSAHFSLVDRSAFLYSVLLGREFLAGSFVVDPEATFLTGASCGPETDAP